jgi:transposase
MAESAVRKIIEQVIAVLLKQLTALEKQIQATIHAVMPSLLKLPGVGPIVAGVLLAETGDPKRFAGPHHFASYCGAAPVERGSGQNRRMQINPGGNRRLNWALHIVAMVRLRIDGGRSKRFLEQAQLRGKTKRSALRLLKTYIARELFRVLSTRQLHSLPAEAHPIG